jgi:hypothetical protein
VGADVAESVEQALRQLSGQTGDSAAQIYAKWQGRTADGDANLDQLIRQVYTAANLSADVRESLEATLRAGGGVGESVEQIFLNLL